MRTAVDIICDGCDKPITLPGSYAVFFGGGQAHHECVELRNSKLTTDDVAMQFAKRVKAIAFSMPAPNEYTPQLVQAAIEFEAWVRGKNGS